MTTFISYSGDRALRVELVHSLRDHGVTPWRDVENLDAGDPTTDTIEAELSGCSSVILWVNETVLASAYVADVELPAIARSARDRAIRITPVFDGLTPSEAAERISRFGIEIGDNNGHVVDPSLTSADTAAAIALADATGEVRTAARSGRPPIVRLVTYDDTAAHRDDAVLNLDWRHRFGGTDLDNGSEHRLRSALASTTAAMKAIYGATEVTLAVKAPADRRRARPRFRGTHRLHHPDDTGRPHLRRRSSRHCGYAAARGGVQQGPHRCSSSCGGGGGHPRHRGRRQRLRGRR